MNCVSRGITGLFFSCSGFVCRILFDLQRWSIKQKKVTGRKWMTEYITANSSTLYEKRSILIINNSYKIDLESDILFRRHPTHCFFYLLVQAFRWKHENIKIQTVLYFLQHCVLKHLTNTITNRTKKLI